MKKIFLLIIILGCIVLRAANEKDNGWQPYNFKVVTTDSTVIYYLQIGKHGSMIDSINDVGDTSYVYFRNGKVRKWIEKPGANGVTPIDGILDWDAVNNRYVPFSSKQGTYSFFTGTDLPDGSINQLKINSDLVASDFQTYNPSDATDYSYLNYGAMAIINNNVIVGKFMYNAASDVDNIFLNATTKTTGNLINLQENGVTLFKVDGNGNVTAAGSISGSSSGDMLITTYDPQNISADAFDLNNHTGMVSLDVVNNIIDSIVKAKLDSIYAVTIYRDTTGMHSNDTVPGQWINQGNGRARLDLTCRYINPSETGGSSVDITDLRDTVKNLITLLSTVYESNRAQSDSIRVNNIANTKANDSIKNLNQHIAYIYTLLEAEPPVFDVTAPVINAIEIGGYADNIFTIKWSENIYKDSCSLDGIVITENGNTFGTDSIWNNADSTYIRMDSIAVYGVTYLFSYTRGADSAFCDSSYNYVANVSNHAINNNVAEVPLYGNNIISNGTFNTNATGWGTTGWAWESDGSGGGRLRHDGVQSNTSSQSTTSQVGVTYLAGYTIGDMSAGQFRIRVGTTAGTSRTAAGTYEEQIVCAGDNYVRLDPVVASFNGWVDDVSVREVLGAYEMDDNMMLYALRDILTNEISYKYVYEDLAASVEYKTNEIKIYE